MVMMTALTKTRTIVWVQLGTSTWKVYRTASQETHYQISSLHSFGLLNSYSNYNLIINE